MVNKQVIGNIIVYSGKSGNSSCIIDNEKRIIIDPSSIYESALADKLDLKDYKIYLTHSHPDHFKYTNLNGRKIFANEITEEGMKNPVNYFNENRLQRFVVAYFFLQPTTQL